MQAQLIKSAQLPGRSSSCSGLALLGIAGDSHRAAQRALRRRACHGGPASTAPLPCSSGSVCILPACSTACSLRGMRPCAARAALGAHAAICCARALLRLTSLWLCAAGRALPHLRPWCAPKCQGLGLAPAPLWVPLACRRRRPSALAGMLVQAQRRPYRYPTLVKALAADTHPGRHRRLGVKGHSSPRPCAA